MHKKSTDELLKLISKESRLDTFLKNNAEEFEATSLKDELARLSSLHHTTKADIIRLSLLDKTYTYQILDGNAEQLHPRNIRDSVIIYSINHHTSVLDTNQILYDMGKEPLM